MGRSKSRTRTLRTNQRLRSDLTAPAYTPKPVGYAKLTPLTPRDLQSPLTFKTSQPTRTRVRPQPTPHRQPSRSNRAGDRIRASVSKGVWTQIGDTVREAPKETTPRETMVCVSRQQRREVLHAFQKTGKAGQKRPVYNWQSKIHCKKR